MDPAEPLALGMFWGGLLVAAVPILFTLGVCAYLLWRYRIARPEGSSKKSSSIE